MGKIKWNKWTWWNGRVKTAGRQKAVRKLVFEGQWEVIVYLANDLVWIYCPLLSRGFKGLSKNPQQVTLILNPLLLGHCNTGCTFGQTCSLLLANTGNWLVAARIHCHQAVHTGFCFWRGHFNEENCENIHINVVLEPFDLCRSATFVKHCRNQTQEVTAGQFSADKCYFSQAHTPRNTPVSPTFMTIVKVTVGPRLPLVVKPATSMIKQLQAISLALFLSLRWSLVTSLKTLILDLLSAAHSTHMNTFLKSVSTFPFGVLHTHPDYYPSSSSSSSLQIRLL